MNNIFVIIDTRARRCIECVFGVFVSKWRDLKTTIGNKIETAMMIVFAVLPAHNVIKYNDGNRDAIPKTWHKARGNNGDKGTQSRTGTHSTQVREQLV